MNQRRLDLLKDGNGLQMFYVRERLFFGSWLAKDGRAQIAISGT